MRAHWYSRIFVVLTGLLLAACDKPSAPEPHTNTADPAVQVASDWEAHIADYPKGWVAAEAPLYIRFTHPVVSHDQVNTALDSTLISLDNKIPVNLTFTSTTDLRIQPAERLPSDTPIRLRLNPKGLQGVDESLEDFVFDVRTIKQDFDLKVNSLGLMDDNEDQMQLSGSVITADTAELEQVKKILQIQVNGSATDAVWTQELDKKTHNFLVTGIARGTATGNIHLVWDGATLGSNDKGARDLEIPAKTVFQITGVQVKHDEQERVEIQFSDELNDAQNLNGLITLAGKPVSASVDGSVIRFALDQSASGEQELRVSAAIASRTHKTLASDYQQPLVLQLVKPLVRFVGKTSILPLQQKYPCPLKRRVWIRCK